MQFPTTSGAAPQDTELAAISQRGSFQSDSQGSQLTANWRAVWRESKVLLSVLLRAVAWSNFPPGSVPSRNLLHEGSVIVSSAVYQSEIRRLRLQIPRINPARLAPTGRHFAHGRPTFG